MDNVYSYFEIKHSKIFIDLMSVWNESSRIHWMPRATWRAREKGGREGVQCKIIDRELEREQYFKVLDTWYHMHLF